MVRNISLKLFVSLVMSVVFVSYFEKPQINFFMPLWGFLYAPQQTVGKDLHTFLPKGMPHKVSKDRCYVNPWQASGVVSPIAELVLRSGCLSIDGKDKDKLIEFANYFVKTAQIRESDGFKFAVWPYPIRFSYGLQPGWISGMAQGDVAVVLAGASFCSEHPNSSLFEQYARLAIGSFEISVENGGVLVHVDGGNWYEEYAQPGIKPPLVLNGHNYAVFALGKLRDFDERAEDLYYSGVSAVAENIHHFDAITWSYYDRVGTPANNNYQPLHARQMKELYHLTGNDTFLHYHKKFSAQLLSPFSSAQRFYLNPARFLGFLLVVNTIAIWVLLVFIGSLVKFLKRGKPPVKITHLTSVHPGTCLLREGIPKERIHQVGDVMCDAALILWRKSCAADPGGGLPMSNYMSTFTTVRFNFVPFLPNTAGAINCRLQ